MFVKSEEKAPGELHEQPYREICEEGQILLDAAALIEKHGHCNWAARGNDGSMCAHRAIYEAEDKLYGAVETPKGDAARRRLAALLDGRPVTIWSNASNKAIVVETMRRAALGS
jgi:hypothetical protein